VGPTRVVLVPGWNEQAKLMADAMASFGHAFLEKSGAIEVEEADRRH